MTIFSISCLLLNLTNGYSILHNIKVANGLILDSNLIFSTVVPLTLLIFLILTIYKSVECMSEIEETSNIVSKIFNLKLNLELEEMFRTFSRQIFHRNRKVKCGFFVIDWTLLQKVCYYKYSRNPRVYNFRSRNSRIVNSRIWKLEDCTCDNPKNCNE
jgi:hypothetical protein